MAALGVLVATFVLALLQLGIIGPGVPVASASPDDLLPVLIASGLLCVIALARRRSPTVTWLATIAAAAVVTIDLARYTGAVREEAGAAVRAAPNRYALAHSTRSRMAAAAVPP